MRMDSTFNTKSRRPFTPFSRIVTLADDNGGKGKYIAKMQFICLKQIDAQYIIRI